jgi:hypothetical protein
VAKIWKDNGLTIALMLMFIASLAGHFIVGWHVENEQLARHGEAAITLSEFASSPLFLATLFENWESEFLQMATYVLLTACLFQRGSAESRDPDEAPRDAGLAAQGKRPEAPAMLRWGRTMRDLYANSLGLALVLLFVISFVLHWQFSAREAAAEAASHGEAGQSALEYLGSAQFWFESFQNWQSEFLSTAVLVVLSIFLRQRESPESKPVAAAHGDTGAQ